MAGVDRLPDVILDNILARLPTKPLLRCRCVSKHWNRLIRDPYFIKSIRAHRMIIFVTGDKRLNLVDANDPANSMLNLRSPCECWRYRYRDVRVVGTINGIVVLQYYGGVRATLPPDCVGDLMLFNPFTRKYLKLSHGDEGQYCTTPFQWDPFGFPHDITYAYGFGYGGSENNLKIVRFKEYNKKCRNNICGGGVCEIFSLKEFTWSKPRDMKNIKHIRFGETMGIFLNGFLYWIQDKIDKLVVLDVAKILVSETHLPFQRSYNNYISRCCDRLGTIHQRLCLLNSNDVRFNLWVMNENSSWSIRCSFTLDINNDSFDHHIICIMDNGRILMRYREKLCIFDTSAYTLTDFPISDPDPRGGLTTIHGIEYVETLVSLSSLC